MLKESYIANWRKIPKDAIKIRVARPHILSPSEKLLSDYKKYEKQYLKCYMTKQSARMLAWNNSNYVIRYKNEIMSNPKAIVEIKRIRRLSKEKDVYLLCYEKDYPCHRFILLEIIGDCKK